LEKNFTQPYLCRWRPGIQQLEYLAVCSGFEIHVTEYGDPNGQIILGVHGLGGQGRNFASLAGNLGSHFRLVCPDLIGRGKSEWSTKPELDYCFNVYLEILEDLMDQLAVEKLAWIGTSMGGALGMQAAAGKLSNRIQALVLNDIGPDLPKTVLKEIAVAIASKTCFESYRELAKHLGAFLGGMARRPNSVEHWLEFAVTGSRRLRDGKLMLHHDPRITAQFEHHARDYENWRAFRRIQCPILIIRGAESTVLEAGIADRMVTENRHSTLCTLQNWGHAPFLDTPEDARLVEAFLRRIPGS